MTSSDFLDSILGQGLITSPPDQRDETVKVERLLEAHRPPDIPSRIGAVFATNDKERLLRSAKESERDDTILKFNTLDTPCSSYVTFKTGTLITIAEMVQGREVDSELIEQMGNTDKLFWDISIGGPVRTKGDLSKVTPTVEEANKQLRSIGAPEVPFVESKTELIGVEEFYFNCDIPAEAIEVVETNI